MEELARLFANTFFTSENDKRTPGSGMAPTVHTRAGYSSTAGDIELYPTGNRTSSAAIVEGGDDEV